MCQILQRISRKRFRKIQETSIQKPLDPIDHAIHLFNLIRMRISLGDHTIQTAVDDCGWTAGLPDDQIFLAHILLLIPET